MSSSSFWIKNLKDEKDVAFVGVGGRVGTSSAQEFLEHCHGLLDSGRKHIAIDMSQVEFIASSGAGTMVVLSESFRAKNGTVQIVNAAEAVKRVVDLLNIQRFVVLADNEEEVFANLQSLGV